MYRVRNVNHKISEPDFLRSDLAQSEIQSAEVMPGAVFGKLIDGPLEKGAGIGSLVEEQVSHTAIE
jgi:hypothetical protein